MAREYKITEVLATYDAQYGKKRIAFRTQETEDKSLSVFTAYPDTVREGMTVFGDITEKVVDGKTFYNFAFAKKEASTSAPIPSSGINVDKVYNLINLKVLPILERLEHLITGEMKGKEDYWPVDENGV